MELDFEVSAVREKDEDTDLVELREPEGAPRRNVLHVEVAAGLVNVRDPITVTVSRATTE